MGEYAWGWVDMIKRGGWVGTGGHEWWTDYMYMQSWCVCNVYLFYRGEKEFGQFEKRIRWINEKS